MKRTPERCRDTDRRRRDIRAHDVNGIDYVQIDETQTVITVYFLGKVPDDITKANVRIDGGRRVRIRVLDVSACDPDDARADGCLQITVEKPGDFSTYTLRLVRSNSRGLPGNEPLPGFDVRYAQLDFSFKAGCPTDLDCAPVPCAPEVLDEPEIDYLAKDYASFRQLILDRLSLIMPEWTERHVPDLGIALVELLAYTGDQLSYYQDAVATEAYLGTARQRISVRRHAKLIDYQVHEGCNARAWVYIETDSDGPMDDASFLSATKNRLAWNKGVLGEDDMRNVPLADYEVFEPVGERKGRVFYQAHNRIAFYTWGESECCLPRGATSATLADAWIDTPPPQPKDDDYDHKKKYDDDCPADPPPPPPRKRRLHLRAGDVLIFEEMLGPITGQAADADRAHRHVVRLTKAEPGVDALYDQPVIEIEWASEDALPFPLCVSAIGRAPECRYLEDVSVAHGNVILVDHGRTVSTESWEVPPVIEESSCDACEPIHAVVSPPFRPSPLRFSPITHAAPFPARAVVARRQSQLLAQLTQAVHARVEQLWRASQDGRTLSADEVKELATIFGAKATKDAGLAKPGGQHHALADLLERETRLLAKKSRRVDALAARARAGYALGDMENADLVEMFGESLAGLAGIGSDVTLGPASLALTQDPREAIPFVRLTESGTGESWTARADLLDSGSQDRHFVVEIDDDGRAHLRFGDGSSGRTPIPGTTLAASYRTGNGTRGNVGAEAISKIVFFHGTDSGGNRRVRNPLPAQGGTVPEPLAEVKLFAPGAIRKLERAVISDDYARLAERSDPAAIQRAAAPPLRWNGSWYEAQVAIDPRDREELQDALRDEVEGYLHRYRRIGHDLRVTPARYVALDVALHICVLPHYLRAHVEAELLDLFSNRDLGGGRRGFFHPDNLTFGEDVRLSRLVAAAQAVSGVESVTVTRLQRLHEDEHDEIENGILPLAALEVARLDNDPGAPHHGVLKLNLRGGR